MEQHTLSIAALILTLAAPSAFAASSEVPLPILFQYSPIQLGRSLSTATTLEDFTPQLIFKNKIALNQMGEAALGGRCTVVATQAGSDTTAGFFNSHLNTAPGGKILAGAAYEMRLVAYQEEMLKIELVAPKEKIPTLALTCTHSNIQAWTVSEFESSINNLARIHASAKLNAMKFNFSTVANESPKLKSLRGSSFNGIFGSGLPGTMGIQLLLGADLKAYAEETNAPLMVGKRCKLISQNDQAFSDHYLKGSKFAFREYRVEKKGRVELVFDNWNHSPHQVRVECRGELDQVKQMTVAEVEHDLNGTIQFYRK